MLALLGITGHYTLSAVLTAVLPHEEVALVIFKTGCFKDCTFAGSDIKLARIGWHDGVADILKDNRIIIDCNQNNTLVST